MEMARVPPIGANALDLMAKFKHFRPDSLHFFPFGLVATRVVQGFDRSPSVSNPKQHALFDEWFHFFGYVTNNSSSLWKAYSMDFGHWSHQEATLGHSFDRFTYLLHRQRCFSVK